MKNSNGKFKKELNGRGRRPLTPSKPHDKDYHNRKNHLRFRDEMDDLEDLRRQGVRIG